MTTRCLVALALIGCGSVENERHDAGTTDGGAVDAAIDAVDVSPRIVFVTSTTHRGSFGGVTGGDGICQMRASAAGLPGTYMVWLADASTAPATRMTRSAGPYRLVTGTLVAQGWTDFTDGVLAAPIDRTETGVQMLGPGCDSNAPYCHYICEGGEVWSNVEASGVRRTGSTSCGDWKSSGGNGALGNSSKVTSLWTAGSCVNASCLSELPLFCIQQ